MLAQQNIFSARVDRDRREPWGETSPLMTANILVVAAREQRDDVLQKLHQAGLGRQLVLWADEPYAAVVRLTRHVGARISLVILPLRSLAPGEVEVVATLKRLRPPVRVVISDLELHHEMAFRACRLGADAMLAGGRLFRPFGRTAAGLAKPSGPIRVETGAVSQASQPASPSPAIPTKLHGAAEPLDGPPPSGSILSPEELRALLEEP